MSILDALGKQRRRAKLAEAERDALKALLAEADAALANVPEWQSIEALRDRIDAALREGGK